MHASLAPRVNTGMNPHDGRSDLPMRQSSSSLLCARTGFAVVSHPILSRPILSLLDLFSLFGLMGGGWTMDDGWKLGPLELCASFVLHHLLRGDCRWLALWPTYLPGQMIDEGAGGHMDRWMRGREERDRERVYIKLHGEAYAFWIFLFLLDTYPKFLT